MKLTLPDESVLDLSGPRIMGILNVTPDSFSDGGRYVDPRVAAEHAVAMVREGAQVIDVGGESTRPGSVRISADEQIDRVVPVIRAVRAALAQAGATAAISIDTMLSDVAAAALDAGAGIVNDVAAGGRDPGMLQLAAARGAPIVLMHMQGTPETMQQSPSYNNVIEEVRAHLLERAAAAEAAGVARSQIVIDPGIGFGKTREHNLQLLAGLPRLVEAGYPVLVGTSRKRFMGSLCTRPDGQAPAAHELLGATCATTALGAAAGVKIFRVHDVAPNWQAARVAAAIAEGDVRGN